MHEKKSSRASPKPLMNICKGAHICVYPAQTHYSCFLPPLRRLSLDCRLRFVRGWSSTQLADRGHVAIDGESGPVISRTTTQQVNERFPFHFSHSRSSHHMYEYVPEVGNCAGEFIAGRHINYFKYGDGTDGGSP